MFEALQTLASAAVMERATLLLNHVLASEAVATQRLRNHAGSCIRLQFEGWPALLPALPDTTFRITPAGLLEWCRDEAPADAALQVSIAAGNPVQALLHVLAGERPQINVAGGAALAADVNWLFDNLRWDVVDDLENLVGPAAAQQIGKLGGAIAAAVQRAAKTLAEAGQGRPEGGQPMP